MRNSSIVAPSHSRYGTVPQHRRLHGLAINTASLQLNTGNTWTKDTAVLSCTECMHALETHACIHAVNTALCNLLAFSTLRLHPLTPLLDLVSNGCIQRLAVLCFYTTMLFLLSCKVPTLYANCHLLTT
jgi:hypothetical protein